MFSAAFSILSLCLSSLNEQTHYSLLADCKTCTLSAKITYYIDKEKYQEAIDMSKPIISGELSCGSIPEHIYNTVLWESDFTKELIK